MRPWKAAAAVAALGLAAAGCTDTRVPGPVEPEPPVRHVVVSGTVFGLDGPAPAGLRATLVGTPRTWSDVEADGSFVVEGKAAGDSVSVIIDAASGARSALPALVRVATAAPGPALRIILVPIRWTIEAGTYAGTTVDVSMDAAFRPPCTESGNTNCDGFFPASWLTGVKVWPAAALPVRLAFDHARTHVAISAADSTAFWNVVARMSDDAGLPLFQPARAADVGLSAAGTPSNGVVIRIDTTLVGFGAWANWWWNASGEMYAGVVRPRTLNAFRHAPLMTHELLHTHGVKHSCSWSTVMGGYGGCGSAPGLSVGDVAYFQLARRVHEAQRARGAPHGLVAALQGERVVIRQLPLFAAAGTARLHAMRTDSIGDRDGDHAH
jgi:hypothetical protein